VAATDAIGCHGRPDHPRGPLEREALRGPRARLLEVGEYFPDPRVGRDGVADEPRPLGRDGFRGADDLHAQSRIVAELPDDAATDLEALAVVAGEAHERARMPRQELL